MPFEMWPRKNRSRKVRVEHHFEIDCVTSRKHTKSMFGRPRFLLRPKDPWTRERDSEHPRAARVIRPLVGQETTQRSGEISTLWAYLHR